VPERPTFLDKPPASEATRTARSPGGPRLAKLSDDETAAQVIAGTVNDALGAAPDQLADAAPTPVRAAVSWGRQPSAKPSSP